MNIPLWWNFHLTNKIERYFRRQILLQCLMDAFNIKW